MFQSHGSLIDICVLLFVKSAKSKRLHVTEMKFIPQIRYMTIHKWLELYLICDHEISVWCEEPPSAIIVSECRDMESKTAWICSWESTSILVQLPPHFVWKFLKHQECLPETHYEQVANQPYPRQFDGWYVWCFWRRLLQSSPHMADIVLLKYGI